MQLLTENSELCVCFVCKLLFPVQRIYGAKVAEVPLLGTRLQYR